MAGINSSYLVGDASDLKRLEWVGTRLHQTRLTDPFAGLMGSDPIGSVIFTKTSVNAGRGNTVIFDYDGFLTGSGTVTGKTGVSGKGEVKRLFSDTITIDRVRIPVDNGDPFDARNVGRTDAERLQDSGTKLADALNFKRQQNFMDCAQGTLGPVTPSHVIRPNGRTAKGNLVAGDIMDLTLLQRISLAMTEGAGFDTGADRMPLLPYQLKNGRPVFLLYLDPIDMANLRKDSEWSSAVQTADTRGLENLFFNSKAMQFENLLLSELPRFSGDATILDGSTLAGSAIIRPGARLFASGSGTIKHTRSFILGAGAMCYAKGTDPVVTTEVRDHGTFNESVLTVHHNMKRTRLTPEGADYTPALKDIDLGIITIECYGRAS